MVFKAEEVDFRAIIFLFFYVRRLNGFEKRLGTSKRKTEEGSKWVIFSVLIHIPRVSYASSASEKEGESVRARESQ